MQRLAIPLLTLALLAAACGSTAETTTTAPPATTAEPTTTTAAPTTTAATTTTTTTTTTTEPPTTTTTTLPGDPIDIGPRAGDRIAVVGVEFDDVLNLRAAPGTDQEILRGLEPTYDRLIAKGNARQLPASIWYEVDADGTVGWVSSRFVAYIGATDDITLAIVDDLGEIPRADTMLELADIVADVVKSDDPPSRVTVTVEPATGDLGEVTIDVIGLGDDAVFGIRLVILGQPDDGGFSLMAVEQTSLCARGVDADGICV